MLLLLHHQLMLHFDNPTVPHSNIKDDETVIFFNQDAYRDPTEPERWIVPIHGWVYEPQSSRFRIAAVQRLFRSKFGLQLDETNRDIFTRRVNLFLSDNERGKRIVGNFAGVPYQSIKSSANGHFHASVTVADADLQPLQNEGIVDFAAELSPQDSRQFGGLVRLVEPKGLSVISDIDDTVKVTQVTDRIRMLENTFYKPFVAVPGMAKRFHQWAKRDIPTHFVSSSPWYLYPELQTFFDETGFPFATQALKAFRFRDTSILNLLKEGSETKPVQISEIFRKFPERKFVLIGDSGEQDPEVYAAIKQRHGEQVHSIWIRNVTEESASNERFRRLRQMLHGQDIHLFSHGDELPDLM